MLQPIQFQPQAQLLHEPKRPRGRNVRGAERVEDVEDGVGIRQHRGEAISVRTIAVDDLERFVAVAVEHGTQTRSGGDVEDGEHAPTSARLGIAGDSGPLRSQLAEP